MTFSVVFDVALALVLVYFLFSVAASKINESVASKLQFRADGLVVGVRRLLHGGTEAAPVPASSRLTVDKLLDMELVKNESAPGKRPAYIRPRTFALAMIDLLAPPLEGLLAGIRQAVQGTAGTAGAAGAPGGTAELVRTILDDPTLDDATRVANLRVAVASPTEGDAASGSGMSAEALAQVRALLDEAAVVVAGPPGDPLAQVRLAVQHLPDDHPAKRPLLRFVQDAGVDRDKLIHELEGWYNGVMARVSGWYKRRVQTFILAYAVVLTVLFNADTLAIANNLYRDSGSRQAVAAAAITQSAGKTPEDVQSAIQHSQALSIPIGWVLSQESPGTHSYDGRHIPRRAGDWVLKILGLLITVGALSFGAPFWFDALGKLANVRGVGQKPGTATGTATSPAPPR